MDEKDQIAMSQWILERNLNWISAAEVKTGVVFAFNAAMLGSLITTFEAAEARKTLDDYVFSISAILCLLISCFWTALSVLPKLDGPP